MKRGLDPDAVAVLIGLESAFKADARNPHGSASGLFQTIASTVKAWQKQGFPYSIEDIRGMTSDEQLAYVGPKVLSQLQSVVGNSTDPGTYYMAWFLPAFAHRPDDMVIAKEGSAEVDAKGAPTQGAIYSSNKGFDTANKGFYTVGDVKNFFRGKYNAAQKRERIPVYAAELNVAGSGAPASGGGFGPVLLIGGAIGAALLLRKML